MACRIAEVQEGLESLEIMWLAVNSGLDKANNDK